MQRFSQFMPAAVAAFSVLAGVAMAPPAMAAPPLVAASSAAAFNLSLNIDGQKQTLGNQVAASGSAPPAYKSSTSLPSYRKTYAGPAASSITVIGGSVTSSASSAGPSGGQITAVATSSMGEFDAAINTPLGALLTIHSNGVVSHAAFTRDRSGAVKPSGNATIGKLVIDGPLLGITRKAFSGSPKPNQILFQSPDKSVTVYLNRQTTTTAAGKPTSITIDALAIELSNSAVSGSSLSADVVLGSATAN
jgi:hypothetical protein